MLKAISLRLEHVQYEQLRALSFIRRKPMSAMIREAIDAYLLDWEATQEEITLAGDELPAILQAREEARTGIAMAEICRQALADWANNNDDQDTPKETSTDED